MGINAYVPSPDETTDNLRSEMLVAITVILDLVIGAGIKNDAHQHRLNI